MRKIIRLLRYKYRFNKIKRFVKIGKSHLFNNFQLILHRPQSDKVYLTVGIDSIMDCKVIFESESGNVIVGNRNYIGNSTLICRSEILFEDNIFVAWGCYFYDHDSHSLNYLDRENDIAQQLEDFRNGDLFIKNKDWTTVKSKPIRVCSNAWIGMNCLILKGVTIGEGAIVGAGSVVTKDVAPWTVVAGNPAVLIKEIPIDLRRND